MNKKHSKRIGAKHSHKKSAHSSRNKKSSRSGDKSPKREFRPTSPSHQGVITGEIRIGGNGNGYIRRVPTDPHTEIEIGSAFLHTALHNDEVAVRVLSRVAGGKPQGEVVDILHRNKSQFVGVLRKNQGALFVVADDHRMYRDIYIDPKSAQGITPGIKVLAEITAWDSDEEDPVGVIVQAIGKPGEHETEVRAVCLNSHRSE